MNAPPIARIPSPAGRPPRFASRATWLTIAFVAEVLVIDLLKLPEERFAKYAHQDSGVDLTIHYLMGRGLRPTVDFGYIYGLLPLLFNRLWYGLLGRTPAAAHAATVAFNVAVGWGLARFAAGLRVGTAGVALIALAMPDLLRPSTFVLVHVFEQALLVHALADQAGGRRGRALALATACAFVKPSMAYCFGAALLVATALDLRGAPPSAWWRALRPAAITGATLAALLAAAFGVGPLLATLTPGAGIRVYREGGYGFFSTEGRHFWLRPGAGLMGYLRFEIGFWLAGTACLVVAGLAAARRTWHAGSPGSGPVRDEVIATCAVLHLAFVLGFFGNRWSWCYYFDVLVLGLAAAAGRGRREADLAWCLAAMMLLSDKAYFQMIRREWAELAPNPEACGLWMDARERSEWRRVLELIRAERPALLAEEEGAALLIPAFRPPVGAYFVPGHPVPSEVRRKAEQVDEARWVVVVGPLGLRNFDRWPELRAAAEGLEPAWEGETYRVYRRSRRPCAR